MTRLAREILHAAFFFMLGYALLALIATIHDFGTECIVLQIAACVGGACLLLLPSDPPARFIKLSRTMCCLIGAFLWLAFGPNGLAILAAFAVLMIRIRFPELLTADEQANDIPDDAG